MSESANNYTEQNPKNPKTNQSTIPVTPRITTTTEAKVEKNTIPVSEVPIPESNNTIANAIENNKVFDTKDDNDSEIIFNELNRATVDENDVKNLDQLKINIPLSNVDNTSEHRRREIMKHKDNLADVYNDVTSDLQSVIEALRTYTNARDCLLDALKTVKNPENLKLSYEGVGDISADIFKKYAGQKEVKLNGANGFLALTTLTGGLRRIYLWNSGITLTLRSLSISALGKYYQEIAHEDYMYGREFGMYYYLFSDISITEYIVNNLLPQVVCGSSYADWKDIKKLSSVIAYQDFPTIMWALATMMYPNGVDVNFICSEPGCDFIHTEKTDLTKLRLLNTEILTDEMADFFRNSVNQWVYDSDLINYRKMPVFNKKIEIEYTVNDVHKKWSIALRQPTLSEFVDAGNDFLNELRKNCKLSDADMVGMYATYIYTRTYKPWIDSLSLTINYEGEEHTLIIENNGDPDNDKSINLILEEFQAESSDFISKMKEYIYSTKISHIAYYFPECPKCHKEPEMGYGGYLPYDPIQSFFTLTLMRLIRVRSNSEKMNI